jgi:hypothetical protein
MTKSELVAVLFAATCIAFSSSWALSQQVYSVTYTAEFFPQDLTFDRITGYDLVRLKEGSFLAELGKPLLPSKQIRLALPPGMVARKVKVVSTTREEIAGKFEILPAQPPIQLGLSSPDAEFEGPDAEAYASTQPYPGSAAAFVRQTDLAGQAMAIIQLYPLQYVPAERRLVLCTSIKLIVEGADGYQCGDYLSSDISENGRRLYRGAVEDMVVNPEDVRLAAGPKSTGSNLPRAAPFDHVVITSSTLASAFGPLIDWHNQKGIRDTVITTAWIYANYAGADSQKIRQFVADASANWGAAYFLLGGEHSTIPFAYRYYFQQDTPSDQYYSDFDDDWTHEVYVGRVSVGSSAEISTFIDKLLKYEKDPPRADYLLKALFIGMDLDQYTHAEALKNSIDQQYLPSRFALSSVYDSHAGNHRTAAIDALNDGQHLVNHADHCYLDYMGTGDFNHGLGINRSDVDALINNDKASVVVSLGCHPNHMDASDCIAEHFVLRNPYQAAVAFTGNTRSGWGYVANPFALSGELERYWWAGLFDHDKHDLGQALVYTKHQFSIANPDADLKKHCEWTFNLLGEPEMPIWTDDPDSFVVTCPSSLPKGKMLFSVHVEDSTTHQPVDSAYVCLWKEGEVYLTGYTDASGDVTFDPTPATTGNIYVTVTKHNYLPHQLEVEVTFVCGDFNVPGGDGTVDLGDVVYLINYLFKGGSAPSPLEAADVNLDLVVEVGDVVYLVNYLYKEGAPPCNPD